MTYTSVHITHILLIYYFDTRHSWQFLLLCTYKYNETDNPYPICIYFYKRLILLVSEPLPHH